MDKRDSLFGSPNDPEQTPGDGDKAERNSWDFFEQDTSTAKTDKSKEVSEKEAKDRTKKSEQDKKKEQEEAEKKAKKEDQQKDKDGKKKSSEQQGTRQQKRRQAVARSKRLIRELGTREHTQLDSLQTVQLVVAERVSQLGAKLDDDEAPSSIDLRMVERQFDFLSLLADKLAEPEREVPPEIEEIYQQIVEATTEMDGADELAAPDTREGVDADDAGDRLLDILARNLRLDDKPDEDENKDEDDALGKPRALASSDTLYDTSGDGDSYIAPPPLDLSRSRVAPSGMSETPQSTEQDRDTTPDQQEAQRRAAATIAVAVIALAAVYRRSRRRKRTAEQARQTTQRHAAGWGRAGLGIGTGGAIHRAASPELSSIASSAPGQSSDSGISTPPTSYDVAAQLRSHLEHTESVHLPTQPNEQAREYPTQAGYPPHVAVTHRPRTHYTTTPEIQTTHDHPEIIGTSFDTSPASHVPKTTLPDAPVETWSLGEMLHAAEAIPLGHGRYLRHAFEHGEIDREGLVKVLKDWKKGRAYTSTFDRQYAALAKRRAESHEYLREDRQRAARTAAGDHTAEPTADTTALAPDEATANTAPDTSISDIFDSATSSHNSRAEAPAGTPTPASSEDIPRVTTVIVVTTIVVSVAILGATLLFLL